MKKNLMTLAAVLCCVLINPLFTSCTKAGGDDNNTPGTVEIKGIGARYLVGVTEQMAQLCDYTITYYGINGQLTTEQATWTVKDGTAKWTKDVSNTRFPGIFGLKVSVRVKEGAQLEGVKIDNIYPVSSLLYVQGITTDAQMAWEKTVSLTGGASTHASTSAEKLAAYTEAWERHGGVLNMTYTFDKDGRQISTGSIE